MEPQHIFHKAIDNLGKNIPVIGEWTTVPQKDVDGRIDLKFESGNHALYAEVKQHVRGPILNHLQELQKKYRNFIVITDHLFPQIKKELRERSINYLEANGNIFLKDKDTFLLMDMNEPLPVEQKKPGRAFTKTGLRIVFEFLLDERLINTSYREIAERTGTGIGNINNIMTNLKQEGFLLTVAKNTFKLNDRGALLTKWAENYEKKLKPELNIGTFRLLKGQNLKEWKNMPLDYDKNFWGGEPAGNLLTGYLQPAEWILYTKETRADLTKRYQLIPDEGGKIKVYQKFWRFESEYRKVAPPQLVYTDLLNTHDARCIETAQKIYEQYLQG